MAKNIKKRFKKSFNLKYVYPSIALICLFFAVAFMVFFGIEYGNSIGTTPTTPDTPTTPQSQTDPTSKDPTEPPTSTPTTSNQTIITVDENAINTGFLVLVNDDNKCNVDGIDLVNFMENKTSNYMVSNYYASVNQTTVNNLNAMLDDFYQTFGDNDLLVSCGYRSFTEQSEIFQNSVDANGLEYAQQYVQEGGYSEHQTGYAVDFSLYDDSGQTSTFTGDGIYSWIEENCTKYGFHLRYTQEKQSITNIAPESWHFRYVGVPHAIYMENNNLCLEEYIDLLKNHTINSPLEISDINVETHMVYYQLANENNEIIVPSDKEYEISGNNVDGFIITYKN